jgi:hypothetical protein
MLPASKGTWSGIEENTRDCITVVILISLEDSFR